MKSPHQQAVNNLEGLTPPPQTWETSIVIPLAQNILGGLAVALLIGLPTLGIFNQFSLPLQEDDLIIWCLIIGGIVASFATVIRFFGDDIGVVQMAYRLAWDQQEVRIEALQRELRQAMEEVKKANRDQLHVPRTKRTKQLEQIRQDALHIISWYFERIPIDRRACERRNMPQRAWRNARRLLIAAGVMNDQNFLSPSSAEALRLVNEHYNSLIAASENRENYIPAHGNRSSPEQVIVLEKSGTPRRTQGHQRLEDHTKRHRPPP